MLSPALLFDFGGTLDADGLTWLERFRPIYAEHGIRVSAEEFAGAFYASDDALAKRHRLKGLGLEETVRLQVAGVIELLAPARRAAAGAVTASFMAGCRPKLAASARTLERLRRGGRRMAVVSNFCGNLDSVLASEGLLGFFDAVADSGALGFTKPDPRIFRHALERLGVEPSGAWMVGDSLERDMRGAEALGMPHVWVRGAGAGRGRACCPSCMTIRGLGELEALLPAGAQDGRAARPSGRGRGKGVAA